MSLLNYVPYVLSCPTCLVPYVPSFLTCLVPYVLCCPTCLVPSVLSCLTCLMPYVLFALRVLCHTFFRVSSVLPALVSHVSCALRALALPRTLLLFCSSSLTFFRCFKRNMLSCISCLVAFMPCVSCAFADLAIWAFYSLG